MACLLDRRAMPGVVIPKDQSTFMILEMIGVGELFNLPLFESNLSYRKSS